MKKILVVDDERSIRESLRMILKDSYDVRVASSGHEALEILGDDFVDLVILDLIMPTVDGLSILRAIREKSRAAVVILTAIRKLNTAIEAMKLGAVDYLVKPFDPEELQLIVQRIIRARMKDEELDYLRSEIAKNYPTEQIVAESPAMKEIVRQVSKLSAVTSAVLITGESGVGKELIARAIHRNSPRVHMPFVTVHCGAIPEEILESELFGHVKGVFTGATRGRRGMFELADGGTLFLDEISEMNLPTQAKVLRAIQEKEFTKVGGEKILRVDARLIAASNRDLRRMTEEGRFREDLFFRLNVIPLHIPPLRERRQDIGPLAQYFLRRFSREFHAPDKELSGESIAIFENYAWPGNVHELRNAIERSVAMHSEERMLHPSHLSLGWSEKTGRGVIRDEQPDALPSFEKAEHDLNKRLILEALEKSRWKQTAAARMLRISRRRLKYRMDRMGIAPRLGRGRPRIDAICSN